MLFRVIGSTSSGAQDGGSRRPPRRSAAAMRGESWDQDYARAETAAFVTLRGPSLDSQEREPEFK